MSGGGFDDQGALLIVLWLLLAIAVINSVHENGNDELINATNIECGQQINSSTLYYILMNGFVWDGQYQIYRFDSVYYLINDTEDIKEFLLVDSVNEYQYEADFFDCDDYAIALWGNIKQNTSGLAFGYIIVKNQAGLIHAMNFFLDNQDRIWLVEPQTDSMWLYSADMDNYKAMMVLI